MLGFTSISAQPISGGPHSLILISSSITATGTLTFSGSAQWGAFVRLSAAGTLAFSGSAIWSSLNPLSGTTGFTFAGSGLLRFAGRPIVFYAVPERLSFVSSPERLAFNALADNFTFKGMR